MKEFLFFSILLCTSIACNNDSKSPKVVIEDKQVFAQKLADLYFIDSWVSRTGSGTRDSIKIMLSSDFESLYGTSVEDFHAELAILKNDAIIYAEIMDSVGLILNKKGKINK